jgi:uncharacterized protein
MDKIMAPTNPISMLFGQSPFGPLQEHMRVVVECANEVPGLIRALCDGDATALDASRDGIFALENSADAIKNELRAHLPRRLFMPVDRRDVLEILDLQDSIADTAQDIAGMLVLRDMQIPEPLHEPLKDYTQRCVDACNQLSRIMEQMDELLETGFRGPESDKVMMMIDELNKIETDTDQKAVNFMRQLFKFEEEIGAVGVILWIRLTHWIGDLANLAERSGNRHRLLLAR